jgi:GNAT superfamily N-acetyltransferase
MTITQRFYKHPQDYQKISSFLVNNFQTGNKDGNWVEPAWEYMHGHPFLQPEHLGKIGIWEIDEEIVAVTHYEWRLGEAFFQFKPGYHYMREQILDFAEINLTAPDGILHAFVNNNDLEFVNLVKSRGYTHLPNEDRPMSRFDVPDHFPEIILPEGFHLLSLKEEPDWAKVHKVMWRGFDHGDNPDMSFDEFEMRRKMFDTTTARRDLKVVVAAPDGEFVSICGMFYQPDGRYGYVEPVATDPEYRRMGLGKAAVLEGIRRCAESGAQEAFVGSNQLFYLALGFEVQYVSQCWQKQIGHV